MNNFKDISTFSNDKDGLGLGFSINYDDLIKSCNLKIVNKERFGSYQGDIFYLVKDENRYGFVVVGFGSCSGCDALYSCTTLDELSLLRDKIYSNITWRNSKKGIINYLEEKDHSKEYYFWLEKSDIKKFIKECKKVLNNHN